MEGEWARSRGRGRRPIDRDRRRRIMLQSDGPNPSSHALCVVVYIRDEDIPQRATMHVSTIRVSRSGRHVTPASVHVYVDKWPNERSGRGPAKPDIMALASLKLAKKYYFGWIVVREKHCFGWKNKLNSVAFKVSRTGPTSCAVPSLFSTRSYHTVYIRMYVWD